MTKTKDGDIEELAIRLRDTLEAVSPAAYVGEYRSGRETTLDGSFDLREVATRLLRQKI